MWPLRPTPAACLHANVRFIVLGWLESAQHGVANIANSRPGREWGGAADG